MRREKCSKKMICQVIALCLMVCTLILPTPVSANVIQGQTQTGVGQVQGLRAGICKANSINVRWEQVQGASGYQIYRSEARNGKYVRLRNIGPGGYAFLNNKNVSMGTEYFYKVRAFKNTSKGRVYGKYSKILRVNSLQTRSIKVRAKFNVNVRKYAGTSYDRLITVPKGTKMTVLCTSKDKAGAKWYRVKVSLNKKSYKGYVRSDLVR